MKDIKKQRQKQFLKAGRGEIRQFLERGKHRNAFKYSLETMNTRGKRIFTVFEEENQKFNIQ